jgi:hypothetical protein
MKVGTRVKYESLRRTKRGKGKITGITETERGLWYEVTDEKTGAVTKTRLSLLRSIAPV